MTNRFATLLKSALRHNSSMIRSRGKVIKSFSKKLGLISFGSVDQIDADHDIIRGLTVSTTHQDSHYAVGSYDGYDISIVDRFDIVIDSSEKSAEHTWLIMQIDLDSPMIDAHVFFKPKNNHDSYEKFFTAFHQLQAVNEMLIETHSPEFHARYDLIAASTHAVGIESILTPEVTNTIAARFWPHAIEILDGKLYVYTTEARLTSTLLEAALESALWFARVLDQPEEN